MNEKTVLASNENATTSKMHILTSAYLQKMIQKTVQFMYGKGGKSRKNGHA